MPLLYHWRDTNYRRDVLDGLSSILHLEQNARWLAETDERGQRLWAFTRNSRSEYVLATCYTVASIHEISAKQKYGRFHIQSEHGSIKWFDTENSPSVDDTLRRLSIGPFAPILGQSFQGHGAIKSITAEDDSILAGFAKDLPLLTGAANHPGKQERVPTHPVGLTIEWEGLEWFDLIPFRFFFDEVESVEESHAVVRRGREGSVMAHCILTTKGTRVVLEYSNPLVEAHNRRERLIPGTLILEFSNERRNQITSDGVGWQRKGQAVIEWGGARVHWPAREVGTTYRSPRGKKARRRTVTVKDRPGQPAFRSTLLETYASCCITGNRLPEALEAAHIEQFEGEEFDHPGNGLLLRKDLHALFDAGLLAFHPTTGVAYFAKGVSQEAYPELHGVARLKKPYSRFSRRAPSRGALKARWKEFGLKR